MNKKIIVYGTNLESERFLYRHANEIDVRFFIDNNYLSDMLFHGKKVYDLEECSITQLSKYEIVICATTRYSEMARTLKVKGLKEYDNFIDCHSFNKDKYAVIFGNCHVINIWSYLCQSEELKKYME